MPAPVSANSAVQDFDASCGHVNCAALKLGGIAAERAIRDVDSATIDKERVRVVLRTIAVEAAAVDDERDARAVGSNCAAPTGVVGASRNIRCLDPRSNYQPDGSAVGRVAVP